MIDYQNLRLFHQHGSEWGELRRKEVHDAAERDPEHAYGEHPQFFRCDQCDEDVMVSTTDPRSGLAPRD